jgi:hypothetical protein
MLSYLQLVLQNQYYFSESIIFSRLMKHFLALINVYSSCINQDLFCPACLWSCRLYSHYFFNLCFELHISFFLLLDCQFFTLWVTHKFVLFSLQVFHFNISLMLTNCFTTLPATAILNWFCVLFSFRFRLTNFFDLTFVMYACFDSKFTILGKHHQIHCIIVLAIHVCSLFYCYNFIIYYTILDNGYYWTLGCF